MQTQTQAAAFPPIHRSPADVAKIIEFTGWESFDQLSKRTGESTKALRAMAERKVPPSTAVLAAFALEVDGDGYLWRFQ